MRHHRPLFENIKQRPEMNLPDARFHTAAAFVLGYDAACEGGLLEGFREWLLPHCRTGSNLWWPALVLRLAFPDARSPEDEPAKSPQHERQAVETLFRLIAEFDQARQDQDGVRTIFTEFERWEKSRHAT